MASSDAGGTGKFSQDAGGVSEASSVSSDEGGADKASSEPGRAGKFSQDAGGADKDSPDAGGVDKALSDARGALDVEIQSWNAQLLGSVHTAKTFKEDICSGWFFFNPYDRSVYDYTSTPGMVTNMDRMS